MSIRRRVISTSYRIMTKALPLIMPHNFNQEPYHAGSPHNKVSDLLKILFNFSNIFERSKAKKHQQGIYDLNNTLCVFETIYDFSHKVKTNKLNKRNANWYYVIRPQTTL